MSLQINSSLRLLIWNANGISFRIHELRNFVAHNDYHIILLQELKSANPNSFKIPNYSVHFNFRDSTSNRPAGGTAIYVKHNIPFTPLPSLNTTNIEHTLVQINISSHNPINIVSSYACQPRNSPLTGDLNKFLNLNIPTILAGDFNAHHTLWNCRSNNRYGNNIFDFLHNSNSSIGFPSSCTRINPSTGASSTIDFALFLNFHPLHSIQTINTFTSDHLPLSLTVQLSHAIPIQPLTPSIDWNYFTAYLAKSNLFYCYINSPDDVEVAVTKLTNSIKQSLASATTYHSPAPPYTSFPPDLCSLIKKRNHTRRMWQRSRDPALKTIFLNFRRKVKRKIIKFKQNSWKNFILSHAEENNNIYKLTKILRKSSPSSSLPTLTTPLVPPLQTSTSVTL